MSPCPSTTSHAWPLHFLSYLLLEKNMVWRRKGLWILVPSHDSMSLDMLFGLSNPVSSSESKSLEDGTTSQAVRVRIVYEVYGREQLFLLITSSSASCWPLAFQVLHFPLIRSSFPAYLLMIQPRSSPQFFVQVTIVTIINCLVNYLQVSLPNVSCFIDI